MKFERDPEIDDPEFLPPPPSTGEMFLSAVNNYAKQIKRYIESEVERQVKAQLADVPALLWEGEAICQANEPGEWVHFMTGEWPRPHTFKSGDRVYIRVYRR